MKALRILVALSAAMLTISAMPARAQSADDKKKAAPRKILRLEELKVEGRIQKPQAMFLMPRANLNYGDLDRSESFLPKVTRAVEKEPF
jgi:ribosome biogenesis protein Tsr3